MKYRVFVHTPAGTFQHVIRAEDEEAAMERAQRAHPTAQLVEVRDA